MKTIFLVTQKEADLARAMEKRLLELPETAGILFVGIEVIQDPFEKTRAALFKVFVGCSRDREPSLMDAIVRRYLRDLVHERQLAVDARRGISRSS